MGMPSFPAFIWGSAILCFLNSFAQSCEGYFYSSIWPDTGRRFAPKFRPNGWGSDPLSYSHHLWSGSFISEFSMVNSSEKHQGHAPEYLPDPLPYCLSHECLGALIFDALGSVLIGLWQSGNGPKLCLVVSFLMAILAVGSIRFRPQFSGDFWLPISGAAIAFVGIGPEVL